MEERTTSDWEHLLMTCATDTEYRARLAAALASGEDDQIGALLTAIGVQGAERGDLAARVAALKVAHHPMLALYAEFKAPSFVAP